MTGHPTNGPDPVMSTVGQAIGLGRSGDRARARELLGRAWDQVGPGGDPMYRVGIAHSMADVQDDPEEELRWDLRALAAADQLTEQRVAEAGIGTPVAGFYPSLHLNLGEVYRKLGRFTEARKHLRSGLDATRMLGWAPEPADGYQAQVIDALERLGERLAGPLATDR
jgi:hypothetical protein